MDTPNSRTRILVPLEVRLDTDTQKLRLLRARMPVELMKIALETANNAVGALRLRDGGTIPIDAVVAMTESIVEGFAAAKGLL